MGNEEKVAVLGASADPERYSNMAVALLLEHGHTVYPVTPRGGRIYGLDCYKSLPEIPEKLDTVTIYVNPEISTRLAPQIIAVHPKRVIMNPGAENPELARQCEENGISVVQACSLVLLRTNQF